MTQFYTNGIARFTIDKDGNVGLFDNPNAIVPTQKLDVDGQIRMRGTSGTAGYIPISDADGVMTWTDPLTISTADDGDWTITNVSDMYSTPSGNVGIGTIPSGTSKLEVAGSIHINNGGFIKSKGSSPIVLGSDDANVFIGGNGSESIILANSNNLVLETMRYVDDIKFKTGKEVSNNGNKTTQPIIDANQNNHPDFITNPLIECWDLNGNMANDPNEDINGDGVFDELDCPRVGIDEITPTQKLDVNGQIRMRGTSGTAGYVPVSDADGVMTWSDPSTILPSGTINQTLRHNGTTWVANSSILKTHWIQSLINGTASAGESVMFISNTGKDQTSLNPLDQTPFTISRNSTLVESIQTFVNDGSTVFHYNNDETQGHIRFIIENSDSEGTADGSNANSTEILTLRANNLGALTLINSTAQVTSLATGTNNPDEIVTADADGVLSTTTVASLGDNLGNHTATSNIILSGNWISNDGDDEGIQISDAGDVGIGIAPNASYKLYIDGKIKTTGITELSDVRYKKDINTIESALAKIKQLRGVTYEWKNPTLENNRNGLQSGLIAQEVELIIPSVVDTDVDGFKSVQYSHLVPYLIESIKELNAEIEKLQLSNNLKDQKIDQLRSEVNHSSLENQEMKDMILQLFEKLCLEYDADGSVISKSK